MNLREQIQVAQQVLRKVDIPLLPQEALALQKLFNESDLPDIRAIKQLISANPFLAGELISLANQPNISNQAPNPVKDLDSALYRLGNKRLKNYILSIYINQLLNSMKIKGLSYHSQDIALIMAEIARSTRLLGVDEAYLLGLIHDIGGFALSEIDENYGQIFVGRMRNHYSMYKQEYARFGTTHTALGYVIADNWGLPPLISQTILLHHEPNLQAIKNTQLRQWTAILELAHALAVEKSNQMSVSLEIKKVLQESSTVLNLQEETLKRIRLSIG
ncbi:HDOD domain-containing protein [Thiomicrorhabdus sp. zzn3]|uniref:HDOD domain-containing protein n=1 Tax=Thiomicrorhabdus sp. zzn3 TaxID=3039775 RepID=UPI002437090C|nr:HDOD domain-containing protein [Thiomicrorhabdus sp. zzn3]MDG6777265.1 HDOD domain-containing protein [Thiomicrorhabdus sp. zzn3]